MDVYLDNHATTRCDPEVLEAMLPWFSEQYGNAASRSHSWGYAARTAVETARGQLAGRLGCSPKAIVFTSGATEANNLAILGTLRASPKSKRHVITVASEHKAVLDAAAQAERLGGSVTLLAPGPDGRVDPEAVASAITPQTALVSVMWVNNETGTIQPVQAIGAVCQERGVRFHTDAAQALSSVPMALRTCPIDLLSLSAHKAYGPKGIGALYVRRTRPTLELEPLQFGGGHERGLRSGTLPVPLVVGMGAAAHRFDPAEIARVATLRDRLESALLEVGGITVNGTREHRVAGNLNVSIDGVEARALMMGCRSIAMSSSSACTSESLAPSHVLRAMGIPADRASRSIRFGVGRFTTEAEIEFAIATLVAKIAELRGLADLLKV